MPPYTILSQPPPRPLDLAADRCLLFAYGQLQPRLLPPKSLTQAWPDTARGLLYDLGLYPAAIQIDAAVGWFHGYVLEIAEAELSDRLDPFEAVDKGVYRRIRTFTAAGFDVWIYEYNKSLPKSAVGPIERWPSRPV